MHCVVPLCEHVDGGIRVTRDLELAAEHVAQEAPTVLEDKPLPFKLHERRALSQIVKMKSRFEEVVENFLSVRILRDAPLVETHEETL